MCKLGGRDHNATSYSTETKKGSRETRPPFQGRDHNATSYSAETWKGQISNPILWNFRKITIPQKGESKIYSYTTFGARHTRTTSKSLGGPITSVKTRFEIALKHCQEFRIRHLCRRCGPFKNFRQITIAPKGDFRGIPYRVLFHALGMGHDFSKWIKFQL